MLLHLRTLGLLQAKDIANKEEDVSRNLPGGIRKLNGNLISVTSTY